MCYLVLDCSFISLIIIGITVRKQCGTFINQCGQISLTYLQRHPIAHLLGRDMGVFCRTKPVRSASFTEVMYAISCYFGPRCNGTQLYNVLFIEQITVADNSFL